MPILCTRCSNCSMFRLCVSTSVGRIYQRIQRSFRFFAASHVRRCPKTEPCPQPFYRPALTEFDLLRIRPIEQPSDRVSCLFLRSRPHEPCFPHEALAPFHVKLATGFACACSLAQRRSLPGCWTTVQ